METYEGGLAEQSVTHFYGGASSTPKRQMAQKKKRKKIHKPKMGNSK